MKLLMLRLLWGPNYCSIILRTFYLQLQLGMAEAPVVADGVLDCDLQLHLC
jgi:hypothetical protein